MNTSTSASLRVGTPQKEEERVMSMPAQRWTPEQLETLRRLFPDTPMTDIAEQTGQPLYAVAKKAKLLGLKRNPDYNQYDYYGRYVGKGKFKTD